MANKEDEYLILRDVNIIEINFSGEKLLVHEVVPRSSFWGGHWFVAGVKRSERTTSWGTNDAIQVRLIEDEAEQEAIKALLKERNSNYEVVVFYPGKGL